MNIKMILTIFFTIIRCEMQYCVNRACVNLAVCSLQRQTLARFKLVILYLLYDMKEGMVKQLTVAA